MKADTVIVEKEFNVPVSLLWKIWTDPAFVKIWFGSDPNGMVLSADIDLSVGGKYRISFKDADDKMHTAFGAYVEVVEFSKVRYTWEWVSEQGHVTELEVSFIPKGEKTLLILKHANLNPHSLHGYFDGWTSTLDKIVRKIIEPQFPEFGNVNG